MVKIRLKRGGKKFVPHYQVVVSDARSPRDGKFIEEVGYYDPTLKDCRLKKERITYWLSVGAQPTDAVKKLFRSQEITIDFKKVASK